MDSKLVLRSCCTYPGYTSTYECTVVGTQLGVTVWRGSALDCLHEEIVLLHSHFTSENGAYGVCNNGSIVGRSLPTQNGSYYTSQLNVTVSPSMIGKSITCVHDDSMGNINIIGSLNISVSGERSMAIASCLSI